MRGCKGFILFIQCMTCGTNFLELNSHKHVYDISADSLQDARHCIMLQGITLLQQNLAILVQPCC